MNNINEKNTFWTEDPTILYKNNNYLDFFPTFKMSRIEQLNSVTRFCIYFFIVALICEKSESWLQFPIIIIFCVYILYILFKHDKKGLVEEFLRYNTNEQFKNSHKYNKKHNIDDDENEDNNHEIEIGQFQNDTDEIIFNGYIKSHDDKNKIKYNYKDYEFYKKNSCKKPTPNNPFMNPTVNDFELDFQPEACNADDEEIKQQIDNSFNEGLFRDVSDVFEIENSQRQFYTVPNMNPPDTITFANWLYKPTNICKTDQTKCLRYEDIRYNR